MAKRGRKPKRALIWQSNKEILTSGLSLLLIFLGVISIVAVFAGLTAESGTITSKFKEILVKYFGFISIFLSFVLIYSGLFIIGTLRWKILKKRILIGLTTLFVSLSGLLASLGGLTGIFLRTQLTKLISPVGAWFFFFLLFAFSVVLITGVGFRTIFEKVYKAIDWVRVKVLRMELPEEGEVDENEDSNEERLLLEDGKESENIQLNLKDRKYGVVENFTNNAEEAEELIDLEDSSKVKIMAHPTGPVEDISEFFNKDDLPEIELDDDEKETSKAKRRLKKEEDIEIEDKTSVSRLPFSNQLWEYPSLKLLEDRPNEEADAGNVQERAKSIEDTLKAFGIKANVANLHVGPAFTRYDLDLAIGTKASKVQSIATDLALRLKSPSGSVRVVAPIPGTNLVGIEVPNFTPSTVSLRTVLESDEMKKSKSKLTVAVGHNVEGNPVVQNMARWPHALVAGATGSGKSVMLNAIIATLLFRCSPSECRFIMIDPKMVELSQYNGIPHLLTPVVTDIEQKAVSVLAWAIAEMDRRYKLFANAGVRNLDAYNKLSGFQAEPYIVIVIDEIADMMMIAASEVERYVTRLAQKSRATGIHLLLSTQRPSVNVLTGTIKANVPTRIAFKVTSQVDSRVIIDQSGAETLIGRGDMLFIPPDDSKARRIQGVFVSDKEIHDLVEFLKNSGMEPEYKEEIVKQKVSTSSSSVSSEGVDEKFKEAIELVISDGKASTSYIQRKLGLGYSRAARMIDDMEDAGIIGQARGSKPREVLLSNIEDALLRVKGEEDES